MTSLLSRRWPTLLLLAACAGLAAPALAAPPRAVVIALAVAAAAAALTVAQGVPRLAFVALLLGCTGLVWGGLRMDALERSVLRERLGEVASARVVVTSPARRVGDSLRMFGDVERFGADRVRERVLVVLPKGRSPPRGAVLEVVRARPKAPRGPETGFDERAWLERRGVHVVLNAGDARVVGRRGGIGGVADRLRAHVERSLARGARGERLALLRGIVLGDDGGLSASLRDDFRASGLAHLTAVSGQNVAIVALGLSWLAWLLAVGRLGTQLVAIAGIAGYALAVGWEPSVARATVAGAVACVAVLASRRTDGWHAMALGALMLLAWRPPTVLDPGFQLSFAAVAAILVTVPRLDARAHGYPRALQPLIWMGVAVACSVATAPIVWLHFGYIAIWTVPANVAAEPAMPLVLGLALGGALVEPVLPWATTTLSWLAGEAAAWIAGCASAFAGLPHAEAHSPAVLGVVAAIVVVATGVARLPPYRRAAVVLAVAVTAAAALSF
ncbi:MAG: ComEC family competence protein, partial [Thermoleophilia bacterium]|nr:ComEC family competence protein [Thermoleophilia bacterium]